MSEFVQIDYCLEKERLIDDTIELIAYPFPMVNPTTEARVAKIHFISDKMLGTVTPVLISKIYESPVVLNTKMNFFFVCIMVSDQVNFYYREDIIYIIRIICDRVALQ